MNRVDELMVLNTISLSPNMSVKDAVRLLTQYKLDGAPVIASDGKVVGILTEYDLSLKGTGIHLPTLLKLFEEFDFYKVDKSKGGLATLLSMRVGDVMNKEPILLRRNSSITEAAKIFAEHHHLNPISVVQEDGRLAGVLNRHDLISYYAGGGSQLFRPSEGKQELDKNVNKFLGSFENRFLFVSKSRTKLWLIFSLLFLVIGFFVAIASLVRIEFR